MGTATDDERGGVDWRQLALVSLCLVGLIVAAFLAPPPIAGNGLGGGEGGQLPPSVDRTPGDDREQRRDGGGGGVTGGTDPIPIPGDSPPPTEDGCGVLIESEPKAGHSLTVQVYQDLAPAASTRVWFNDRYVGQTDQNGAVTGRVPYQRDLNVTVESPGSEPCQFYRRPYDDGPVDSASASVAESADPLPLNAADPVEGTLDSAVSDITRSPDSAAGNQQTATANDTGQYRVGGRLNVSVVGEPYPGESVTLVATVDGVPVPNATVQVDGDTVGRTDTAGRYQLRVPDSDTASVTVSRGEFTGTAGIDVLDLTARVVPEKALPVPGDDAVVNATINGAPVENASVTLAGEPLGTTGADGAVALSLPRDPTLSVTATTARQTATTTLWDAYIGTVVLSAFLLVATILTVALAALLYSPTVARAIGIFWAILDSLFFVGVLWERDGLAIGLAIVGVAALYHYRASAVSGGQAVAGAARSLGDRLASLAVSTVRWTRRAGIRLVGLIEVTLTKARRLAARLTAWLRSLPLSLSALGQRLRHWLISVGHRSIAVLTSGVTPLRITAFGFYGVFVTLAYVRRGVTGAAVAGAVLAVCAVGVYVYSQAEGTDRSTSEASPKTGGQSFASTTDAESSLPSLRELWRAFARLVVPGQWRTRTPGEVSRAAIDNGLPREPVESLTEAFREVEYGGEPTETRRDQAREAYDALVGATDDAEDQE